MRCGDRHSFCIFCVVFCHARLPIFCYSDVRVKKMFFLLEESSQSLLGVALSCCASSMVVVLGWQFAAGLDAWFDCVDGGLLLWACGGGYS